VYCLRAGKLNGLAHSPLGIGTAGQTTLLIGVLAQLAGLGCRINVINVGAGYLKDKKATRMARAVKKSK